MDCLGKHADDGPVAELVPLSLFGELFQAILENPYRFGEALDAVDMAGCAVAVQINAEISYHLAEAPEALCRQKGEDGLGIPSGMACVHEFVRGPSRHAHIIEGLTEFPQQGPVGSLSGLKVPVQHPQFGCKFDEFG